jgi:hypothetical protein
MFISSNELNIIKLNHPGKVPLFITKEKKFPYVWQNCKTKDTVKLLISEDANVMKLRTEIYKILYRLNAKPITDAIYLSVGGNIITGNNFLISDVQERYQNNSGVLYITICCENAFG